jgi:chaperonin GroES
LIPPSVKEGDHVLLPEYGGSQIKLDDKEYVISILFFFSFDAFVVCFNMKLCLGICEARTLLGVNTDTRGFKM